jgi:tryptophan-rich sensory protein
MNRDAVRWVGLPVWLALSFGAGAYGALSTMEGVRSWYPTLAKPAWTPPAWVFGPVWTFLYLLMGIAAWLVWCEWPTRDVRRPLGLFLAQLALNAAWSLLFFGWRRPGIAFGEIVLLLALILLTMAAFQRVRPVAGWLMAPYAGWVAFASALNGTIWWMNRGG